MGPRARADLDRLDAVLLRPVEIVACLGRILRNGISARGGCKSRLAGPLGALARRRRLGLEGVPPGEVLPGSGVWTAIVGAVGGSGEVSGSERGQHRDLLVVEPLGDLFEEPLGHE